MGTIFRFLSFYLMLDISYTNHILYPIKEGEDIGISFITGAYLTWEQYLDVAATIQEVYPGRLWIHLQNNYFYKKEDYTFQEDDFNLNNTLLGSGKLELFAAGMPEEAVFYGMGHSLGGVFAYLERQQTQIEDLTDGIILLSATMYDKAYETYPVPCMTITGDLDGQMRTVLVAADYRFAYEQISSGDESYKYNFPNRLMIGVNHAMFCTGELGQIVEDYWIEPEISQEESWQLIAESVSTFIIYHTDSDLSEEAEAELDIYSDVMTSYVPPFYQAFDEEKHPVQDYSPWAITGQSMLFHLQDEEDTIVQVKNEVMTRLALIRSEPLIENNDNGTHTIYTYTHLYISDDSENTNFTTTTMETKYKSSQAINEAISGEDIDLDPTIFCNNINEVVWSNVYDIIGDRQRERYLSQNITVIFQEDSYQLTEDEWMDSTSRFYFNGTQLDIQATTFISDTSEAVNGGMHHCKLVSPARVMEFMYSDVLLTNYYTVK